MNKEFQQFINQNAEAVPSHLSDIIFKEVHADLDPSWSQIFGKVVLIHTVLGFVTLSICSQFGLQTFPVLDLMYAFMSVVGPKYCMAFCGAIFLGGSAFSFAMLLTRPELLKVRKNGVLQILILSILSLAILAFFGAEVLLIPALLWLTGATVAGVLSLELGVRVRNHFMGGFTGV